MKIGGAIMIVMGVLLYFDMMTKIIAFLTPILEDLLVSSFTYIREEGA